MAKDFHNTGRVRKVRPRNGLRDITIERVEEALSMLRPGFRSDEHLLGSRPPTTALAKRHRESTEVTLRLPQDVWFIIMSNCGSFSDLRALVHCCKDAYSIFHQHSGLATANVVERTGFPVRTRLWKAISRDLRDDMPAGRRLRLLVVRMAMIEAAFRSYKSQIVDGIADRYAGRFDVKVCSKCVMLNRLDIRSLKHERVDRLSVVMERFIHEFTILLDYVNHMRILSRHDGASTLHHDLMEISRGMLKLQRFEILSWGWPTLDLLLQTPGSVRELELFPGDDLTKSLALTLPRHLPPPLLEQIAQAVYHPYASYDHFGADGQLQIDQWLCRRLALRPRRMIFGDSFFDES